MRGPHAGPANLSPLCTRIRGGQKNEHGRLMRFSLTRIVSKLHYFSFPQTASSTPSRPVKAAPKDKLKEPHRNPWSLKGEQPDTDRKPLCDKLAEALVLQSRERTTYLLGAACNSRVRKTKGMVTASRWENLVLQEIAELQSS